MKLKKALRLLNKQDKTAAIVRVMGKSKKVKIITGKTNVIRFLEFAPMRVLQVN